jgi:hypothetical protein
MTQNKIRLLDLFKYYKQFRINLQRWLSLRRRSTKPTLTSLVATKVGSKPGVKAASRAIMPLP